MKKSIKVEIADRQCQRYGEAIWSFELIESGAFDYGNGTAVKVEIEGQVNGDPFRGEKLFDTRYWRGIKSEEGFTEFCIETVRDFYGENATAVEEV
jgi:hypothetical protein